MDLKIASLFDIDGTLMSGLVIVSFPYFLEKRNLFDKEVLKEFDSLIGQYKTGTISYRELGTEIPKQYAIGIQGQKPEDIKEASNDFLETQKNNVYDFSKNLISFTKKTGSAIAITGSPIEPMTAMNRIYGFDEIYATEVEIKNKTYTEKLIQNMVLKETKEKTIFDLKEKYGFDLKNSFGFGDTEQDLAILENVGHPIALNPNNELKDVCIKRNWPFFNKNDNLLPKIKDMIENNLKPWNQEIGNINKLQ